MICPCYSSHEKLQEIITPMWSQKHAVYWRIFVKYKKLTYFMLITMIFLVDEKSYCSKQKLE